MAWCGKPYIPDFDFAFVDLSAKGMLAKISFPREALILSGIGQSIFNLIINLMIGLVILIVFKIPFTWGAVFAILAALVLVLLGTASGMLVTPLGVLYSDVSQGINLATYIWFFLTPVVYPTPTSPTFSILALMNPVRPILSGARDLVTQGVLNNPVAFIMVIALMLAVLFVTWVVFRLAAPILIERMG